MKPVVVSITIGVATIHDIFKEKNGKNQLSESDNRGGNAVSLRMLYMPPWRYFVHLRRPLSLLKESCCRLIGKSCLVVRYRVQSANIRVPLYVFFVEQLESVQIDFDLCHVVDKMLPYPGPNPVPNLNSNPNPHYSTPYPVSPNPTLVSPIFSLSTPTSPGATPRVIYPRTPKVHSAKYHYPTLNPKLLRLKITVYFVCIISLTPCARHPDRPGLLAILGNLRRMFDWCSQTA